MASAAEGAGSFGRSDDISLGSATAAAAAAMAAALPVSLLGAGPIFPVEVHSTLPWQELGLALPMGMVAGLGSGALTRLVYASEDLFARLPLHPMWWPVIGGAVVGLGGLLYPHALGVGYDVVADLLRGHFVGTFLLGFLITKAVIWAVALGSGSSGGVLAGDLVTDVLRRLADGDPTVGHRHAWPVLDGDASLGGLVTRGDLVRALDAVGPNVTVGEAASRPLIVAHPDELLAEAVDRLVRHGVGRLPVVDPRRPSRLLGYLGRTGIGTPWVSCWTRGSSGRRVGHGPGTPAAAAGQAALAPPHVGLTQV